MEGYINPIESSPAGPKKRVLFVITQSEFGGAQQFLFQLLQQIHKDNYDLHVSVGKDGDGSFSRALESLAIPHSIIPSLRRNINPISDLRAISRIRELIIAFQPDTLFLLSSKAGFIGSLAGKLSPKKPKIIYRIGGWSFNDPIPNWQKKLWIYLERLSAGWKDIIILNNKKDLNQAEQLHIKAKMGMELIYNGIDPYRLKLLPREEAREKIFKLAGSVPDNKKIVGALANFYPTKGLEYLIESALEINDHNSIVCIFGDGAERTKLENLILKNKLEKKVFLLGRPPNASQYISGFDVFVMPSVKEGFPWSILEAMSAKLPIVATDVGAVSEIIQNGLNGYIVEPRNPSQIADRINSILSNELDAQEMAIQAHQRVLFSFTLDYMVRQIKELL